MPYTHTPALYSTLHIHIITWAYTVHSPARAHTHTHTLQHTTHTHNMGIYLYTHTKVHTVHTYAHTVMLCVLLSFVFSLLLSFVFSLSSFMGNNSLARHIFINTFPYGSFSKSMGSSPAAHPVGREFCCLVVLVCSGEGRRQ